MKSPTDIPHRRLQRSIRASARRELEPDTTVITALMDGEVVGVAVWNMPKRLWRAETLLGRLHRLFMSFKDRLEDWIWPSAWYRMELKRKYFDVIAESKQRFLGANHRLNTWYLDILAVHPHHQRKGIGSALLDWGLEQARANGERVYLESTDVGKPFYIARGFEEVVECVLHDDTGKILLPCMVWHPPVGS